MIFSTVVTLAVFGAVIVEASPIAQSMSPMYRASDVVNELNSDVNNAYGFCTNYIQLSPVTITATQIKTDFLKLKVSTTTFKTTATSTISTWTQTIGTSVPQTSTAYTTELVNVLTVTAYVPYVAPPMVKRNVPKQLSRFSPSLISAGCSSYVTSTKTVTINTKTTVYPTTTKSKTVRVKVLSTQLPGASFTVTSTVSITLSLISGTESTITQTSTLSSGQPSPTMDAGNHIFQPVGCYSEGKGGSALAFRKESSGEMTAALCLQSLCQGYRFAGLEYGGECWCGNTILNNASPVASSDCSQLCSGDSTEFCGNAQRLTIYNSTAVVPPNPYPGNAAFNYLGCYAEPTTSRALVQEFTDDTEEAMTPELCLSYCGGAGYKYAGVEYGRECWCDNTLNPLSIKTTADQCSFSCPGNAIEQCGGNKVLNLYQAKA